MKIFTRTRIVLVAALAWLAASAAPVQGQAVGPRYRDPRMAAHPNAKSRVSSRTTAQVTPPAAPGPAAAPESVAAPPPDGTMAYEGGPPAWEGHYDEYDGASFDDGGYCDDGSCGTCRRGLWYFSADYLLVRPRLSQGVAEVRSTLVTTEDGSTPSDLTENLIDTSVNYCFDYNSSFRVALGYRLLDCGGDIQFAYWRLTGDASVFDGPASLEDDELIIRGQLGNDPDEGQFFSAATGITANIYDIDFAKCLSFGGPQDCCECNCCPRWDLRYQAGVRIGDVSRYNNNFVTDPNGDIVSFGNIDARFTGAGPRVGLQGRRYFGACGKLSVFAKGSQALLIGDYTMSRVLTTPSTDTSQPNEIASQFDSFCRMIPVTDIELGATWQVAPYAFASSGWFWQAWWDLGQGENISDSNFGPLDSANILGFDGLFVRGELLF
jgi:hypothetical protein